MESNRPITPPSAPQKEERESAFARILDNPMIAKEFTARMRGNQAFILIFSYLALISFIILMIYNTFSSTGSTTAFDPGFRQGMGKAIFSTVVIMELLLVTFIGPGLTSGAISSEREHQTFDLLRTTLLSARSHVLGKLGSAFAFLFLLILTAIPIQGFAFLIGGVGMEEVIVSILMLIVTALFHCTLGLFYSSFMKRTLTATVSSYITILLSVVITGVIFSLLAVSASNGSQTQSQKDMLTLIIWFLISINPIMSAVMSEVILIDQQSLFYTQNSPFGGSTAMFLLSPWVIYVFTYLVITALLIAASIYFVNRPDK